jgi:hypothetical protein
MPHTQLLALALRAAGDGQSGKATLGQERPQVRDDQVPQAREQIIRHRQSAKRQERRNIA